jgi:hypothetical protein
MTSATTNYGTLLKRAGATIAEVVSIDAPEYSNPEIEATNHSSGGVREFISGLLKEMTPFKATLNELDGGLATIVGDLQNGTVSAWTITFPNTDIQSFSALVTGIKPLTADAQSPDVLKAEVTFRPTGALSLA